MTKLLEENSREKVIIQTSIIGILANVGLVIIKLFAGILSNSIAILLDGVNNLSDAMSSIITILSMKLAGKSPNKKHPFGYGRVEYISTSIIALIVIYAGITSFGESIKKILKPEIASYTPITLIIIIIGVMVKLVLGNYVKKVGKKVNSDSLIASGQEARLDALISFSTLIAALLFLFTKLSIEAFLGAGISLLIIKAGIEMMIEAMNKILGQRVEAELSIEIKAFITREFPIHGAYDLLLHNYGPDRLIGSIHVEVDNTMTADEIDEISRSIQKRVFQKFGILLTTVGIYSIGTMDEFYQQIKSDVSDLMRKEKHLIQMHGFHLDQELKTVSFDVIVDFSAKDREQVVENIQQELQTMYPDIKFMITMDFDVSD